MSAVPSTLLRYWKPVVVVAAGVLSLAFMRPDGYRDVTQELIGLFGLLMAGVLPTMVLTASALRAGNLSVKRINEYRDALSRQLKVWIGLFVISLVACSLVILGKMVAWTLVITIPLELVGFPSVSYDLISIVNALVTVCLVLVILRGFAVGSGIASLLRLTGEIALSEANLRDAERHRAGDDAIGRMSERKGFGDYVELRH